MSKNLIDLDALIDPDLSVKLDGEIVAVQPINGVGLHLLQGMTPDNSAERLYKIASHCLPSLTEERVMRMTPAQVGAVVQLASEGVETVEALASPNFAPAATKRSGRQPSQPVSRQATR